MEPSLAPAMYVFVALLIALSIGVHLTSHLPQTVHENRIYSLKITCGESYPDQPPTVQFLSRVNLPFVDQHNGKVDRNKLPVLANWSRNSSIETVLVEIRRSVNNPTCPHVRAHRSSRSGKWHPSITASCPSLPKVACSEQDH